MAHYASMGAQRAATSLQIKDAEGRGRRCVDDEQAQPNGGLLGQTWWHAPGGAGRRQGETVWRPTWLANVFALK